MTHPQQVGRGKKKPFSPNHYPASLLQPGGTKKLTRRRRPEVGRPGAAADGKNSSRIRPFPMSLFLDALTS